MLNLNMGLMLHGIRDFSWNTMIDGCIKHGKMARWQDDKVHNYVVLTLLQVYLMECQKRDDVACNALMPGHVQNCYCL
jgi:hypothetical protein